MNYKAVEVIWIFLAGRAGRTGRTGRTGIEGSIRGPRGPKNDIRDVGSTADLVLVFFVLLVTTGTHTCEKRVMWRGWLFWQQNVGGKFGLKMA